MASLSTPAFSNAELSNWAEKLKISDFCINIIYVYSLYV